MRRGLLFAIFIAVELTQRLPEGVAGAPEEEE